MHACVHVFWYSVCYVETEVPPGLVTCHFCALAVCGNAPVEKALTILMLLISQHLAPAFSSLCFGTRARKTLYVCVCVSAYALAPRHL